MRRLVATLTLIILCLGTASVASAKISRKQSEELATYVEKFASSQDAETRQAMLYVRGAIADSKGKKELKGLETSDDARTRLGAKIAAVFAGDRKAPERVAAEIAEQGGAAGLLPTMVAPLPDDDEVDVLEELLDGAKPGMLNDVYRYAATQRGPLFGVVLEGLESSDPKVRGAAAAAIVAAGREDALEKVGDLLKSKDRAVRKEAIQLLIAFTDHAGAVADAQKLLFAATKDDAMELKKLAATRLLELQDARARQVMIDLAKQQPEPAAAAAMLAELVEHGAKMSPSAAEQWLGADDAALRLRAHQLAAASNDDEFVGKLLEMYRSTEFDDRLLAVRSIGYTEDKRAGSVLTQSLFEARADIRGAAAEGLVHYADESTLGALKRALTGERDKKIKLKVIEAIGAVGGEKALQMLRFQVTNNDLDIKKATIEAIRSTGAKKGAKALEVLLRDRNTAVQWRAFLAALVLDKSVARPMFDTVFRNPPDQFLVDVDELEPGLRKTIHEYLLTETTGTMRTRAAEVAMREGTFEDELYELAMSSATDSGLRRSLIMHLGDRANRKDLLVLERIARGEDPGLRHLAAWMLTRHPSDSLEASYRGYLAKKDETLQAIAALGLATVWQ